MKRFKILFLVIALMAALLVSVPATAGEKVTICHKPGTEDEVTISVSVNAWNAHEAHGDYAGECRDKIVVECPNEPYAASIPVIGPDPVEYTVVYPTSVQYGYVQSAPQIPYMWNGSLVQSFQPFLTYLDAGEYTYTVQKADPADPDFDHLFYCVYLG